MTERKVREKQWRKKMLKRGGGEIKDEERFRKRGDEAVEQERERQTNPLALRC